MTKPFDLVVHGATGFTGMTATWPLAERSTTLLGARSAAGKGAM